MPTDYVRLREIEEQQAADQAQSDTARHAHRRMAALYAAEAAAREERLVSDEIR